MKRLKTYLSVYVQILRMAASLLMAYRLNLIVQGMFMVVYGVGLFMMIEVIFQQTTTLAGWTKEQILLLYGTYLFMWGLVEFFFFEGLRRFAYSGIKDGELDKYLVKPLNAQFLLALNFPDTSVLPQQLFSLLVIIRQSLLLRDQISLLSILTYLLLNCFSLVTVFFIHACYANLAFYVSNARQTLQGIETLSTHSQYPVTLYPQMVQPFLFSLIPNAFYGFIAVSFLTGKGSWQMLAISVSTFCVAWWLNRTIWQHGLKQYASASS